MSRIATWACVLGMVGAALPAGAGDKLAKVEGYAEWRRGDALIVDGERVKMAPGAKFKGKNEAKDFASIPLGYEVEAKGTRTADGTLMAVEIEAKPNGDALFEKDVRNSYNEIESGFVAQGQMFEAGPQGNQVVGKLSTTGPKVERVKRILDNLIPPYKRKEGYRIYVVDNPEWNAMAAPNNSFYVFSGLLNDMDDDEVAIVIGHEMAHSTHEHGRKHYKSNIITITAAAALVALSSTIDDTGKRTAAQLGSVLAATALSKGFSRNHEDQADRVGLRYAYEAGYEVKKAPRLWQRFADKYGSSGKLGQFFSDHSSALNRAKNAQQEIAYNYSQK